MTFSPCDPSTWPVLLTVEQMAEIKQRSVGAIKKAAQRGRLVPAPIEKHPYRWRKSDVIRYVRAA